MGSPEVPGWGVDLFERGLKLRAGGGEVLQELDLAGELDDEGLVLGRGEHLVEEGAAGGALFVDDVALAEAGVDEQAEGQGKVGVDVEVADGLRMAVDLEDEVVLGEVLDEGAFLVADDDGEVDEAGIDGDGRGGGGRSLLGRGGFRCALRSGVRRKLARTKDRSEQEGHHVELDDCCDGVFQSGTNLPCPCARLGIKSSHFLHVRV